MGAALRPRFWMPIGASLAWLVWLLALPPRPSAWLVAISGSPLLVVGSWLAHPGRRERWRDFVRRTLDYHALAAMLLVALGVQFEDAHGITTDGVIYFSQLRSVLFDRDLNVAAEFAFLGQPPRPYHVVPIGPTLVWLPLYLAVAAVDLVGRTLHAWSGPADPAGVGLTLPYVRAALVSSFAIGAIGLLVVHRHLRGEFDQGVAFVTTLLIFAATPLVWYMVYEPSMTHAASFGFVALFAVTAARWMSLSLTARQSAVLGVLLGLAFITRPQEALFALFPGVLLLTTPGPVSVRLRAALRLAAWAFAGAAGFLALQAIHSAILFSRENFALVGAGGYLDFLRPRWADTLWSSWHGFLSWTPVAYVALIGTALYISRRWQWAMAALIIVFLMAWVNGSTADWAAGWSFGGRRFVSCLVLLAPGLAFILHQLTRRPMISVAALVLVIVAWNQLLLAQYATGLLTANQPVSFRQIIQQQAGLATRSPFFYPFAFPANAWFAWRTGLPIDRYDLLGPEPLAPSIDVAFDGTATKYLLDGWSGRARDAGGDLRWIDAARAELVLPLAIAREAAVTIEVHARTRLFDPPVPATIALSVNGHTIGTFTPDATEPSSRRFLVPPRSEVWKHGFNRFVFEKKTGDSPTAPPPVAIYRVSINPSPNP